MISNFKKVIIIFTSILILIPTYLTFVGFNTDKFNNLLSNKLKNENPDISLTFKKIKFYLKPLTLKFELETLNPTLSIKNNELKIKEITAKISLISLLKNRNSLEQISVRSKDNKVKNLIKILRVYKNNFQTIILDKVVQNGEIKFNLDLELDKKGKVKDNLYIQGNIKKFEISYLGKVSKLNSEFDFIYKENNVIVSNAKINYEETTLIADSIKISKNNNNLFLIEGNIKTNNAKFETNAISEKFSISSNYIKNKIINIDSNTDFSFNINNKAKITNFVATSKTKINNIELLDKKIFKKLFKYEEDIEFINQVLNIEVNIKNFSIFKTAEISVGGSGKFLVDGVADDINYSYKKDKNSKKINILIKLNNNEFYLDELSFIKKRKEKSTLEIDFKINRDQSIKFNKIILKNNKNKFDVSNLNFSKNFKINSFNKINFHFKNTDSKLNSISITKNNDFYIISGESLDGSKIIDDIISGKKSKNQFFDANTNIKIKLKKFYIDSENYIINTNGNLKISKNRISNLNIKSLFFNGEELTLQIKTNNQDEQITNIYTKFPKPLLNRYKFIKGFEDGIFDFQSIKKGDASRSVLIIDNFKVKEVPVLAKILTLASLQGIADLLTGEGIRFTDFEMKFRSENDKILIDEIYAIGPAISLMLDGYLERDRFTSLRGTLVPATTINRTISSIPLLGDILVGKKVGEGVFGVSFKIKGSPKNLKTSVNPIKTLTPRFITRTLEKIKKN